MSKPTSRPRSDLSPKPGEDPDLHRAFYLAGALAAELEKLPDILLERIDHWSPFVAQMCHAHAVLTDTLHHLGITPETPRDSDEE